MKAGGKRATWLVLGALVIGLLLGALSNQAGDGIRQPLITVASTVGGLWLDALKMTVIFRASSQSPPTVDATWTSGSRQAPA